MLKALSETLFVCLLNFFNGVWWGLNGKTRVKLKKLENFLHLLKRYLLSSQLISYIFRGGIFLMSAWKHWQYFSNLDNNYFEQQLSVCRKHTFFGQYIRWESFSSRKRKTNLIATLVHRALMICTKNKLKQEINFIKKILLDNGYPEDIVLKHISKRITQFSTVKPFGPEKCPVYLRAPWIGSASQQLEHQVKSAVQNCYGAVSPRLIFSSQCMLPAAKKDVLPANQRSMVIYEYMCHCDSLYVGCTTQRLQERFKQHVPKAISQKTTLTQEQGIHRSQPTRTQPNRKCKAKSKTNSNQKAIQPLANICWNPISAHATILICSLKF